MGLHGAVAVVPVGDPAVARARELVLRMAAEGVTVVLVTEDEADVAGALAAEVEATGTGRPAVFRLDPAENGLDALVEFLGETFRLAT